MTSPQWLAFFAVFIAVLAALLSGCSIAASSCTDCGKDKQKPCTSDQQCPNTGGDGCLNSPPSEKVGDTFSACGGNKQRPCTGRFGNIGKDGCLSKPYDSDRPGDAPAELRGGVCVSCGRDHQWPCYKIQFNALDIITWIGKDGCVSYPPTEKREDKGDICIACSLLNQPCCIHFKTRRELIGSDGCKSERSPDEIVYYCQDGSNICCQDKGSAAVCPRQRNVTVEAADHTLRVEDVQEKFALKSLTTWSYLHAGSTAAFSLGSGLIFMTFTAVRVVSRRTQRASTEDMERASTEDMQELLELQ